MPAVMPARSPGVTRRNPSSADALKPRASPACQEFSMRNAIIMTLALVTGLSLNACNTVSGAGKDVSSVGKAVTNTANDVKN
jgi:predicted small secreted protein